MTFTAFYGTSECNLELKIVFRLNLVKEGVSEALNSINEKYVDLRIYFFIRATSVPE